MPRFTFALPLALAIACNSTPPVSSDEEASPGRGPEQLAILKSLEGKWVSADGSEGDGSEGEGPRYEIIANGSAVMETVFEGQPHEMVTLFTLAGDDLVLTHFCALGNQPYMRARSSAGTDEIVFDYVSAGDLSSLDEMHMHDARYSFPGPDQLETAWTLWAGGAPQDVHSSSLVRANP
ncbi:MAG: hypothetical protein QF724_04330 [Planctomycetota bacterium]|jgi:hypothetical protein|nr:hypothetical protein [Planctomycetota bacterium]MDP6838142.1 hypothetical protein [Planctomycetota bacterium]MDP6955925.1 hypothetical protein [Planctomycetota bacterium]